MTSLEKLISIGTAPLASMPTSTLANTIEGLEARLDEVDSMLAQKNGFYAFEGALHVFPEQAGDVNPQEITLAEWNGRKLWRVEYDDLTEGLFFFAEDIFGVQFAIQKNDIVSFDPESGEIKRIAGDIEEWAGVILDDFRLLTGFPIAHDWQQQHGALQRGKRLLPKIPFVLGGQYESCNLIAVDAVEGMRYRGELWRQIRDLPDGAQVRLNVLPVH
jgi:hypothetical protein